MLDLALAAPILRSAGLHLLRALPRLAVEAGT